LGIKKEPRGGQELDEEDKEELEDWIAN